MTLTRPIPVAGPQRVGRLADVGMDITLTAARTMAQTRTARRSPTSAEAKPAPITGMARRLDFAEAALLTQPGTATARVPAPVR
jgi:hypothetical protein